MVIIGIFGYSIIEGYSFINAIFMTIITISTVGYREVEPLTDGGKIFTIIMIVFSFGIFAYAVSTLTQYLVDGVFQNYFKINKVKRRIEKVKDHVIICGYGRNGRQAAIEAQEYGFEVLIIEENDAIVRQYLEDSKLMYIQGDSTHDDVLLLAKPELARALITTLPNDADNLFVVLSAKEMNPNLKIISRAADDNSNKKLRRAGATNIIMSDKLGGQRMARLIAEPDVVEFLDHILIQQKSDVGITEISFADMGVVFNCKTIRELEVRESSGVNIIGLRLANGEYVLNPSPDMEINSNDKLFVLGNNEQFDKLKAVLSKCQESK
jgi:voltage-gated potassium channel